MPDQGICKIKSEYVLPDTVREVNFSHISNEDRNKLNSQDLSVNHNLDEPPSKKTKLFKEKRRLRGQNKSRGPSFQRDCGKELCMRISNNTDVEGNQCCNKDGCKFLHDIQEYLKIKPIDLGSTCYVYSISGKCLRGITCRFGKTHLTVEGKNIIDEEKFKNYELSGIYVKNNLSKDLQNKLWKKTYNFDLAEKIVKHNDEIKKTIKQDGKNTENTSGAITDEDIIKLLKREKKSINWRNKIVLSPLTTVGNLPFRRICKEYGADITCGEMAMCHSLLKGQLPEWALIKRHKSEDIFGIQVCGNNPYVLTKCAQLLEQEFEVDYLDLNLGCPIDLVYKQGAGTGLVRRQNVLESCIRNMSDILSIPLTVKTRTGISKGENIAHKLAPKFRDWGASLITIHGRSREQRYTKMADWQYIKDVVEIADPLPVLGNGDILCSDDYQFVQGLIPKMAGVMIGRGALIKPWIFTELKEQKLWDIQSSERLDIIKRYVNYGLEHWGSDNKGVENTRRFLLEWLSFLYRYVPVGLLEKPPQKINERPPKYKGRNELETLMASSSATDWIKITEMLLGPVPHNFQFLPKHKANSYD